MEINYIGHTNVQKRTWLQWIAYETIKHHDQ